MHPGKLGIMNPRTNGSLNRRFRYAVSIMGASSLIFGINEGLSIAEPLPPPPSSPVTGRVLNPDGKPLKAATVYWIERDADGVTQRRFVADTDAQGSFHFPPDARADGRFVVLLVR